MALLEAKNLRFTYSGCSVPALDGFDLTVEEGEFVLLSGASGCGKTTLMRLVKKQLSPRGSLEGSLLFRGVPVHELDDVSSVRDIGYVMQNPDNQIVTDTFASELAFGLQGLGMTADEMGARMAEVAGFFGIGDWYGKKTSALSGGQKQLLSLASVLAMKPSLLLLDEPTSQLDPVSAREFIDCLEKLRDELGIAVVMSEHRCEEVYRLADRVVVMDHGRAAVNASPRNVASELASLGGSLEKYADLPAAPRIYLALGGSCPCPVTVREGREYIARGMSGRAAPSEPEQKTTETVKKAAAISIRDLCFGYEKNAGPVINDLCLDVYEGELLCLLGGNGCGKTTLLKLMCGLLTPLYGKCLVYGKNASQRQKHKKTVAYLPQNQQNVFTGETVAACFDSLAAALGMKQSDAAVLRDALITEYGLENVASRHPYDLSGGEQQRAAIALTMLTNPDVLLLDEPTKGQDAAAKDDLAASLKRFTSAGKTVVIATHDLDFAAENADRCAMIFGGEIAAAAGATLFFAANDYYTTAAARITRPCTRRAVTVESAVEYCKKGGFSYE